MARDSSLPNGEAEYLFSHHLLKEILDQMEADAVETIVMTDDEDRRALHVWEIRSIRNVRQKLKALAEGKTNLPAKRNVA